MAAGALLVIVAGCELFTNAIEWLGVKLKLSTGACGSVLAAVGTALPETIVPIVAILVIGGESSKEVGIGGILGAPFMLATLAFAVTAIGVLVYTRSGRRRTSELQVDTRVLSHDLGYFLVVYVAAIGSSFLPWHWAKLTVAAGLLVLYAYYVWQHFRTGHSIEEEFNMAPLRLTPSVENPRLRWVVGQTLVALGCIFVGAHVFVEHLTEIARSASASPLVLSIIITPIATELPEKFNSVLWVRDSKDTLAMGNITGAMVFQSTIPVTVGLLFTPWALDKNALASAIIALTSGTLVYAHMKIRGHLSPWALLVGLPLYLVFLYIAFWT
ncbi:MAG: sodium:calcium antiporter [Armatimonadetes bacterium]|nr:sodium:calcium antiporter [Armatimonadota bacterium]